jgi:putative hydrolase of the HAD superfamily
MSSPIQLVCFDLGRVLVRICDTWNQACDVAKVPKPAAEPPPPARSKLLELVSKIEVGEGGEGAIDDFCRELSPHVGLSCEQVATVWRSWTLGIYEGAAEVVRDLRSVGVTTACLSNTNVLHWRIMNDPTDPHYAVLSALDYQFASHLIGARKPDERAYEHVERETRTPARAILFFDDVEENVEAARRRGWRGQLVRRCENPIPAIREVLRQEGILESRG